MKKMFLALFLSVVSMSSYSESDLVFEPPQLKNTESSLQNRIKYPKSILTSDLDENVVVRCDALLTRTGKFSLNFCYENGKKHYPYVTAINRAAKHATIKPARINGTVRKVWFQYFVTFFKKGRKHSIEVVPNSGLEINKYGYSYTSAQRYANSSGEFGVGCGFDNEISINAVISSEGKALNVDVVGEQAGEKCKKYLIKSFMEQKFIPAFHDDVAVNSFYSEKIFDNYRAQ